MDPDENRGDSGRAGKPATGPTSFQVHKQAKSQQSRWVGYKEKYAEIYARFSI